MKYGRCVSDEIEHLCWWTRHALTLTLSISLTSRHPMGMVCLLGCCFFLKTQCFLRAHPSVKLGTFTRVDTKTAHSRPSQIRRNIQNFYKLIRNGQATKLLNVEKVTLKTIKFTDWITSAFYMKFFKLFFKSFREKSDHICDYISIV